jgi:two-component system, LytTR family, response regulator
MQSKFSNDTYLQQIGDMFRDFRNVKKYKERFTAHFGRNILLVNADDIACFIKEELIYLVNGEGKKYITDFRSLDEIEELLDPAKFYRANRQFIIAMPAIESLRGDESGKIVVKLKINPSPEVVVSKEKAAAFRKWVEG